MKKCGLKTPAILVDLDIMERNIRRYQEECNRYNKKLWPMIKTHKSTEIVRLQQRFGADGFLAGTLDECEALCDAGIENIMYAYPVSTLPNIRRVIDIAEKSNFIIRLDNLESAYIINEVATKEKVVINYTVIVDSGLHRFGVNPEKVVDLVNKLQKCKGLCFKGISTHPGHVYGATNADEVKKYVDDEKRALKIATEALISSGYELEIISSGATPTFFETVSDEYINIYHPGNYVFNDCIQISTDTARIEDCALTVLASVVSHPTEDLFIIDAGSKCLGLDKGAHGNSAIKGYGYIKGHTELTLYSLSEEVGKIHVCGKTKLKVGDIVEIIPNHACTPANMTSWLIGCRKDVVKQIEVDIRGNYKKQEGVS
ncbi:alanine racemase [Clostridiaceae bacterium M8S5]|nr:alanine racemase [Clostridiaceae bacterium M8S5]